MSLMAPSPRLPVAPVLLLYLLLPLPAPAADPPLPPAAAELPKLREHVGKLLDALDQLKSPLPGETEKQLRALLKPKPDEDAVDVSTDIQKLLDAQCLVAITINPESRVKVARGPAAAELRLGRESVFLIKLQNDAGVTQPLTVSGPHIRTKKDQKEDGIWLDARVHHERPLGKALSGQKLEYVVLRLTPHESGKREATLKFDVGQGTQDLGFRGEVPILFTIREK